MVKNFNKMHNASHLKSLNTKKDQDICNQVLAWERYKNVIKLNWISILPFLRIVSPMAIQIQMNNKNTVQFAFVLKKKKISWGKSTKFNQKIML